MAHFLSVCAWLSKWFGCLWFFLLPVLAYLIYRTGSLNDKLRRSENNLRHSEALKRMVRERNGKLVKELDHLLAVNDNLTAKLGEITGDEAEWKAKRRRECIDHDLYE